MEWLSKAITEKKNTKKIEEIKSTVNKDLSQVLLKIWSKLFENYVNECFRILKDNTAAYFFCSWHNIDVFKQAIEKKFKIKNILIWEKNNTSMGDLKGSYAPKYEMIIFAHKGRKLLNGFRYADIIKANRTGNKNHPTEKPVDLLETFIKNSSGENEVVFDGFMGSGSTGVACVNTGRRFIGIELDDGYFNIAKKRIEEAVNDLP